MKNINRQFKKFLLDILLYFIKALLFLKKIVATFLAGVFYRPLRAILRLFFYNVIVKIYSLYFSFAKKIGLKKFNRGLVRRSFFANQKIVHIVVIVLAGILFYLNLTNQAKTQSVGDIVGGTAIAQMVGGEFSNIADNDLEESFFDLNLIAAPMVHRYNDLATLEDSSPLGIEDNNTSGEDDFVSLVQDGSAIVKPDLATTKKTKRDRTEIVYHEVAQGETISVIAENFDVSVNTILWENNLTAYSVIRPGDKLAILPFTGISYTVSSGDSTAKVASKFGVSESDIIASNHLALSKLKIGQRLLVPGGRKQRVIQLDNSDNSNGTPARIAYSGLSVIKKLIKKPGAKPAAGNMMNWPTVGHRITQYYSWRHTGLDIANKVGTPLYAADAGTVEYVGWGNGYGQQIVINHGGGKKTRYAHLSSYGVKKGQKVGKGAYIGAMGSTGWSTGSHLHFEVIINGNKYNPLGYIK